MLPRCCASSPLSWNTSTLSSLIAMTPRCASDGWPLGLLATMRAGPSDLMNPRATNRFAEQTLPHGQHGQAIHAEGDGRITFCHYKAVRHIGTSCGPLVRYGCTKLQALTDPFNRNAQERETTGKI